MANVALTGRELLLDMNDANPPPGRLAFWWLGQNGFVVKGAEQTIYIDPYLAPSARRQTPVVIDAHQVSNADLILGTHDHGDHVDRVSLPAMLAASPGARLVVSRVVRERLAADGYPAARLVGLDDGESAMLGAATITAIRAAHEFFDRDDELGYPHLGFVIELNATVLFHAGDGIPWDGLASAISFHRPDAMFVPINGRDGERYRRNCIGNFTFQEAVELVGAVRPALAVPMHYDMFVGNQERVERFVDYLDAKYPGIGVWVGSAGERALLP